VLRVERGVGRDRKKLTTDFADWTDFEEVWNESGIHPKW
jgi:hypothetical protein